MLGVEEESIKTLLDLTFDENIMTMVGVVCLSPQRLLQSEMRSYILLILAFKEKKLYIQLLVQAPVDQQID